MKKIIAIALMVLMAFTVMPSQASAATKYIPKESKKAYRNVTGCYGDKIGKYYYNIRFSGATSKLTRSTKLYKTGRVLAKSNEDATFITNGKTVIYSKRNSSYTHITIYAKSTKKNAKAKKLVRLKGTRLVAYYKGKIYYNTGDDMGPLRSYNLRTKKFKTIDKKVGWLSSSFGPRIAYMDGDGTLAIYNIKTGKFHHSKASFDALCVSGKKVYYSSGNKLNTRNLKLKNAKLKKKIKGAGLIYPGRISAEVNKPSGFYRYSYSTKKLKKIAD